MQFTTAIIAAIAVLGVSATPAPWKRPEPSNCLSEGTPSASSPPNPHGSAPSGVEAGPSGASANCPSTSNEYCCTTTTLLGLTCIASSVLGNTCSEQTICCVNNGGSQNCSQTDGTAVSIPINIVLSL